MGRGHSMVAWCGSVTLSEVDNNVAWESLAEAGKGIRPGGQIVIETTAAVGDLAMNLMIAGFVDIKEEQVNGGFKVTGNKPGYEKCATGALKLGGAKSAAAVWSVQSDDYTGEHEVVDEDDLLTQSCPSVAPRAKGRRPARTAPVGMPTN